AADLQDEFDGQERDDAEGDRAGGSDDAEKVPEAAPGDRDVGIKRVSINNRGHGVGGVMEAVHEFESESDEQSDAEQNVRQSRAGAYFSQVAAQVPSDISDRTNGNCSENQRADEAGTFGKFFVDGGSASRSGRGRSDGGHKRLLWSDDLRFECGKLYGSGVT